MSGSFTDNWGSIARVMERNNIFTSHNTFQMSTPYKSGREKFITKFYGDNDEEEYHYTMKFINKQNGSEYFMTMFTKIDKEFLDKHTDPEKLKIRYNTD
jgi:hypothetical protein